MKDYYYEGKREEKIMLLANRVALITGAAGGIGRGIAVKFASEGCDVVAADLKSDGANETLNLVKEQGRDGIALQVDITKSAQVQAMVEKAIEKFGKIDILVNSAGSLFNDADHTKKTIADIPEEDWDTMLNINLKGAFLCCKYVSPYMKEKRYGKIINFSSLGAIHPPTVAPHYNAAKAGIMALTLDSALELGPFGITVNSIMPGPIRTSFYDRIVSTLTEEGKEQRFAKLSDGIPMGRMGTPEDIAGPALFFASDLSQFVTGVNMLAAGGLPLTSRL